MASLSRFKTDLSRVNDGAWITLGEEHNSIEIQTRGFTDAYHDARGARTRRAAARYGGDTAKIPQSDFRKIIIDLLIQHCLLDVRNLEDDKGEPVSFELFKQLLYEDQYQDLYTATLTAAAIVSSERETDLADAKKNLVKPSA